MKTGATFYGTVHVFFLWLWGRKVAGFGRYEGSWQACRLRFSCCLPHGEQLVMSRKKCLQGRFHRRKTMTSIVWIRLGTKCNWHSWPMNTEPHRGFVHSLAAMSSLWSCIVIHHNEFLFVVDGFLLPQLKRQHCLRKYFTRNPLNHKNVSTVQQGVLGQTLRLSCNLLKLSQRNHGVTTTI